MPLKFDLADGRRIAIRSIRESDRAHLEDGLTRLGPRTRWLRFQGARTHFTPAELSYLTECDGSDRLAFVAIGLDDRDEEAIGVGVARAYRDTESPDLAEVAIVVVDDWQKVGVGRNLLRVLAEACLKVGIRRWQALILSENETALRLFGSFGAVDEHRWGVGAQEVFITLPIS